MSGLAAPSSAANVWPRAAGLSPSGPIPLGGGSTGLSNFTNPNLTSTGIGNLPPPVPQAPRTPFPSIQPGLGATNSLASNNYVPTSNYPSANAVVANLQAQNAMRNAQTESYHRRLMQLEDENGLRQQATANLAQMGTHLLQGQMDVQEQVLQYQYMLEQCMETLDHQNYILNEQSEELALLRSKMRHFEYLMDAFKFSKEGEHLMRSMSNDSYYNDNNDLVYCGDPIALPPPSTSPYFAGGPTRITASTFQPFNPRYRSPNSRAATAAQLNTRRSISPPNTNRNLPNSLNRPTRRFGLNN